MCVCVRSSRRTLTHSKKKHRPRRDTDTDTTRRILTHPNNQTTTTNPPRPDPPADAQREKLAAAEETFQNSDTLRKLKEKSDANRALNKKRIENKYCYRQAELGIGDCGGLRLIPGVTKVRACVGDGGVWMCVCVWMCVRACAAFPAFPGLARLPTAPHRFSRASRPASPPRIPTPTHQRHQRAPPQKKTRPGVFRAASRRPQSGSTRCSASRRRRRTPRAARRWRSCCASTDPPHGPSSILRGSCVCVDARRVFFCFSSRRHQSSKEALRWFGKPAGGNYTVWCFFPRSGVQLHSF